MHRYQFHSRVPTDLPTILTDIEDSDDRFVTVVNPWRSASLNHESPDSLARNSSGLIDRPTSNDISDTWKLSWEDVCTIFQGIYLSWNPRMFQHVIVHHGYGEITIFA